MNSVPNPAWLDANVASFHSHYGHSPTLAVWSPGRVNLIGEHTDYNGGLVLPCALTKGTLLLAAPRNDDRCRLKSLTLDAESEVSVVHPQRSPDSPWADYPAGVFHECRALGWNLPGLDVLIDSDLPMGAGLSSSASIEMGFLMLMELFTGQRLEDHEAALLGQRVENQFLGLSSGIMDQFAVRACRQEHALLLECKSLTATQIPVRLGQHCFIVADTASPRRLTSSEYNTRVHECRKALEQLNRFRGKDAPNLNAFQLDALIDSEAAMDPVAFRRARHVLTENQRVRESCEALAAGDARRFGELMNASHESLRDDYEVSSPELNSMVKALRGQPGCLGARLTGAGFGGCCVALVETVRAESVLAHGIEAYRNETGNSGSGFLMTPAGGSRRLEI